MDLIELLRTIIVNILSIYQVMVCPCALSGTEMKKNKNFFDLLRYESSTLILYKELSSTIFQVWVSLSGIGNTCPDLHFLQYIKAWMSSTDTVSSITNCYRLIVSYYYTDPVHSFIIS